MVGLFIRAAWPGPNEAFTPTADEVAWAVDRSLGDSNLLSLVVLLKSYQRLGYFPSITDVPVSVWSVPAFVDSRLSRQFVDVSES